MQRGPQHRLVCFAWGPSAAPTAMHPKEVNLDESRLRQSTFHDHPLISKGKERGAGIALHHLHWFKYLIPAM